MSKPEESNDLDCSNQNETECNGSEFVGALCDVPIINDSINTLKNYKVGQLTFAGACQVSKLAESVSYKFSDQFEKADQFAAASVRQISDTFPIMKQPTDKIINSLKEPTDKIINSLKEPARQLGCTIEDNLTTPGSRFVMDVDSRLAPLVNLLEEYLQKVAPDGKDTTESRDVKGDQQEIAQILRALQITFATGDRCVGKVRQQLTTTQTYTAEQLKQLQLFQTLVGVGTSLRETVQLHTHLQSFTSEENIPKALQAKMVAYTQALLDATDRISSYITSSAKQFPEFFQGRLKPLATFFGEHYGCVVDEIKSGKGTPLEKARNILNLTTTQTIPLLRSSLNEINEAIPRYTNSLNTSIYNTKDALKSHLTTLNVK